MKELGGIISRVLRHNHFPEWARKKRVDMLFSPRRETLNHLQEIANKYGFNDVQEATRFTLGVGISLLNTPGIADSDGSLRVLDQAGEVVEFHTESFKSTG